MTYENYAATSQNYDLTRTPIGVEVLLGCFATAQKSLARLEILDAGCGTASYSLALLPYVRRIVGVDACQEMIECAQEKAKHAAISTDRLSFHQASMESLPFDDSCFDGVMINQVLHHLEDGADDGFPLLRTVLTELARVVRSGGVLVINICSAEQLAHGWWYGALFREAYQRMQQRHISLTLLTSMLAAVRTIVLRISLLVLNTASASASSSGVASGSVNTLIGS